MGGEMGGGGKVQSDIKIMSCELVLEERIAN